jgi:hypothetical protein
LTHPTRRLGGLVVSVVAAAPFAYLWLAMMASARDPLTFRVRLDMAIWTAVFGTPWMVAAQLLWRAWWRRGGAELSALDGPARLVAAAAATLPPERREWGAAMAAELAQVRGRAARWRFAAGCARAAVFPPHANRVAMGVAVALAAATVAATALATSALLPAMRVFAVAFAGLVGGLATLAVARSRRVGRARPDLAVAAPGLAGIAGCIGYTIHYLVNYPSTPRIHPPTTSPTLPPGTALFLATALAGCLWLALVPPRWLLAGRVARRFGLGMAAVLAAGFLLQARPSLAAQLGLGGVVGRNPEVMEYMLSAPLMLVLPGAAVAAAAGRSFRAGLGACAWALVLGAPLIVALWLAEALRVYRQDGGLLLDGDGGVGVIGVGANLGDAVWWTLLSVLLWALPLGVIGAAAGSLPARRRRRAQAVSTGSE